ncbi:site-specific integrase [Pseudomonas siliginis]|uniref:site-specific integrase n=1 Tax=Pseudomonas siliginis TaxID=2842346 RepID=UPI0020926FAD|nr:site-specific integrase [Pseudomonas siliginis]UST75341.1 site-specific integrase [Pseudomonas siliginis]
MNIKITDAGDYVDDFGRLYVRCKADSANPFFVDVTTYRIEAEWRRVKHRIDLQRYNLPSVVKDAAKQYLIDQIELLCPRFFDSLNTALLCLEKNWSDLWKDFSDMSLGELFKIILTDPRPGGVIRRFYKYCARKNLAGADDIYALELESVRLLKRNPAENILEWHETRGALTSSEIELVRRKMVRVIPGESMSNNTARLFVWISFETLKRPIQLAEMLVDALWKPDVGAGDHQYFLRVPKAKHQAGRASELWPITEPLATAIQEYSLKPEVCKRQKKTGRLLVGSKDEGVPSFGSMTSTWCRNLALVSPRTNKRLVLTPYRIRHSGATQMAAQGASRDEIQYVLEHDTVQAADSYIDCLASEFCPLLERANRKLGGVFSELNGLFFAGRVGERNVGSPILIPTVQQPAIVGSCGKNGVCGQHPFFNCYNGCRYFIAWREADHEKSLIYLEAELARWGFSEGGKERSKIQIELERVYQAVKDVVARIKAGE